MHNKMRRMLSNFGHGASAKSRAYRFPSILTEMGGAEMLSDAEFADMLEEIDKFSAQFRLTNKAIKTEIFNGAPQVL